MSSDRLRSIVPMFGGGTRYVGTLDAICEIVEAHQLTTEELVGWHRGTFANVSSRDLIMRRVRHLQQVGFLELDTDHRTLGDADREYDQNQEMETLLQIMCERHSQLSCLSASLRDLTYLQGFINSERDRSSITMVPNSNVNDSKDESNDEETVRDHPIADKHIKSYGNITRKEVHDYLEEIAAMISEETLRDINSATPYAALSKNEDTAGVLTDAIWDQSIFPELGLTFDDSHSDEEFRHIDEARMSIKSSHQSHAVNELDMDHEQPKSFLVAAREHLQ